MAKRQILIPPTHCANPGYFESVLAVLHMQDLITRNQSHVLYQACKHLMPAKITIEQREPKATTYLTIDDSQVYTINGRARLLTNG